MLLNLLKVLNVQGTGNGGLFAAGNGRPVMRRTSEIRRFSRWIAESGKSRGIIALHWSTDTFDAGESNAG